MRCKAHDKAICVLRRTSETRGRVSLPDQLRLLVHDLDPDLSVDWCHPRFPASAADPAAACLLVMTET